jgi:ligand-binding sensor domain-containing protein/two-component sensor histidine kinase
VIVERPEKPASPCTAEFSDNIRLRFPSPSICGFPRFQLFLAWIFFAMPPASALDPRYAISQYGHAAWTRAEGRMPGMVLAVTQGRDGPLWVGTEFGLFRFDGVSFVSWTPPSGELPSPSVTALRPDADGGLWIGTRKGLCYWNKGFFKSVSVPGAFSGAGVSAILIDRRGTVWASFTGFHAGGLCRVDSSRSRCVQVGSWLKERMFSLFEDREGTIFAGGTKGLYAVNDSPIRPYAAYDAARGISGIAQAPDGALIWTDRSYGPHQLRKGAIEPYLPGLGDREHAVTLLADRDGAVWVGTWEKGLIHSHHGQIDRYTRSEGLSSDTVFALFEDRESNIWCATEKGLDRFRDLPVVTVSKRDGLSQDTATSVFPARTGGMWISTTEGLNLFQQHRSSVYQKREGLPSDIPTSLFEDRSGTLWIDSPVGMAFGRNGHFQPWNPPGGGAITSVTAAVERPNGDICFADLERGVICAHGGRIGEVLPKTLFGQRRATALAVDPGSGDLLIGFYEGGVAAYRQADQLRWYTAKDGIAGGEVTDMQTDREGALWIATGGGLSRLRNGRILTLTARNGLGCGQVHGLVQDNDGAMWLNTSCGLLRLRWADLAAWITNPQATVHPRLYGDSDGMLARPRPDGYFRRAAKSSDGRLWFPVLDGVAVVDPHRLAENPLPPPLAIDHVLADGRSYPAQAGLLLPIGAREVAIDYTAFTFTDPNRVRFRYRLQGYDSRWKDAEGRRRAFFSNLAPGRYRFEVIACNDGELWNEAGSALEFSVPPAVYQMLWFRLASGVALLGLGWLGYCIRLQRMRAQIHLLFEERLQERTRIARELHDTLLQNISGFALQIEALAKVVTAPVAAKDQLRDLRREAEHWIREARDSVSDLRSPTSDRADLVRNVRRIGAQIAKNGQIQFDLIVDRPPALPIRLHDALLRIIQEALRNAVQHACADRITVELSCPDPARMVVRVCDNGIGFDLQAAGRKARHWGIATMRERAEAIGAEFRMVTNPGRGTEVEVAIPIRD